MKAYEKLYKFYKKDWGKDSIRYVDLIINVISTFNLNVSSILDVGCGTGILAKELKNMNFEVSGIDISEDMINVANETTAGIEFAVSDMRNFNLNKKFDMITCTFDAINYVIADEDMKDTMNNIYYHLNSNGFFIFDINTPYLYEDKHFGVIKREFDGIHFEQILEYDRTTQIGTTLFDFGNDDLEKHVQRAYSVEKMDEYLVNAGFKIIGRYKNFRMFPIEDRTYKVFYVAKKK
ncbi:class I SAM-dependent methyltransferase [Clostridium sp. LIBA-8841]|uniref:class I SAM-dependent DNA methyltransferase n=1 Tax=Clostridium sp. LIBA-8841 TaxID=2987530 RepID=UPI002AC650AB|nr:class I SAM-dependent methyltransferase [Clostridium sp. LIBA-8841]MDZ5253836.1 class I SAM-dependent methyltransferase [Clostridium sp. LIBA-8841]